MKILVTGATGKIGRQLLPRLVDAGHRIIAVSRRPPAGSPAVSWIAGDLAGPAPLASPGEVDAVLHLAGQPYDPRLAPEAFERANVTATERLLGQLGMWAGASTPHVVFASTIYVYGELSVRPFSESDIPAPGTAYGRSKLEAERRLAEESGRCGLPFTILRLPAVYGTGAGDPLAVLAAAFRHGGAFVIDGGEQRRSLLGVANLAGLVLDLLGDARWHGLTVNVADPGGYRVLDLVRHAAPGRRVHRLPSQWVRRARSLPILGAVTDRLQRLGDSLELDTARLEELHRGPFERLPLPV